MLRCPQAEAEIFLPGLLGQYVIGANEVANRFADVDRILMAPLIGRINSPCKSRHTKESGAFKSIAANASSFGCQLHA